MNVAVSLLIKFGPSACKIESVHGYFLERTTKFQNISQLLVLPVFSPHSVVAKMYLLHPLLCRCVKITLRQSTHWSTNSGNVDLFGLTRVWRILQDMYNEIMKIFWTRQLKPCRIWKSWKAKYGASNTLFFRVCHWFQLRVPSQTPNFVYSRYACTRIPFL